MIFHGTGYASSQTARSCRTSIRMATATDNGRTSDGRLVTREIINVIPRMSSSKLFPEGETVWHPRLQGKDRSALAMSPLAHLGPDSTSAQRPLSGPFRTTIARREYAAV